MLLNSHWPRVRIRNRHRSDHRDESNRRSSKRSSVGRPTVYGLAALVLVLGGAIGSVTTSARAAQTPSGADPQGTIYVADCGLNAIDVFAPGSSGNVAPERVISGADTGLECPADVKVDSSGDVYSSNFSGDSITEYAPGASGDATPICTLAGSNTGLDANDDMSLEPDGSLVVGNFTDSSGDTGSVELFPPNSCGNVAPSAVIAGSNTGFNTVDGVGTDAHGTIYANSSVNESIQIFPAGTNGNVAPTSTISGSNTGLGYPDDIVVGFDSKLYVTSGFGGPVNSVTVYAPGATGNATPVQNITGSNTDFGLPDDLAVDTSGDVFVTDSESSLGPAVLEWNSGATGNVAPNSSLVGSNTTFEEPEGVAVAGPPGQSSPTLTSQVASSSISLGQGTSDTATLAGGSSPTGSLEFRLYGPGDPTCSGAPAYTSPFVNVTGDGNYPSPSFTPTATGNYSWVDDYSGDSNNSGSETQCTDPHEQVTVSNVSQTPTQTSTSLSGGGQSGGTISVSPGTAVTDQATISGTNASSASGTVTYSVFSDAECTVSAGSGGTKTVTGGAVGPSDPVSLTTPGTYYWQATYSGDTTNQGSSSTCGSEVETVAGTSTLGCDLGNVTVGPPSGLVFTAQDATAGLASVDVTRHKDSTFSVSPFTPGTTGPVSATFTKKNEPVAGSAGIEATSESGNAVACAAQYKTLKPLKVNSQGFTFKGFENTLVIQNGTKGLKSVEVTLNGTTTTVSLTPGETYSQALSGLNKASNKMVVQGFGPGKSSAVVLVWGHPKA
jgi:hypothetical protein